MFKSFFTFCLVGGITLVVLGQQPWPAQKANAWYAKQPFLVGANFVPSNAINQLEMFQAETFDPATIDKELGWAAAIGMNTMRIFLHDLLVQQDPQGFFKRLDQVLSICAKHNIKPMLVLFDSCWYPFPATGPQQAPTPGIHNSYWLQSPGANALTDVSQYPRLEMYVKSVVNRFKNDNRILMWDIWNEPDNTNTNSWGKSGKNVEPAHKVTIITHLLPHVFRWVRSQNPSQPVTCGVWQPWNNNLWQDLNRISEIEKIQFENSDVITFHHYGKPEDFEKIIQTLNRYGRPLICTEYMARGSNSLFTNILPIAKKYKVGAINWGLVAGKTQTNLPWDSWQNPYINGREPKVWFHEVFLPDGNPYKPEEVEAIKAATGKK
ncbi:MAG: cellulase family glycosylhydrolase [Runella sp.]